ncbi:MAG: hypothetical protein KAQ85_00125 [Thermodesulfovibrionia bacterium]|nr:hypothetical protein [Thermodesulfovibrionia bacterium]
MEILLNLNILIGLGVAFLILALTSYFGMNFYLTVKKQAPSILAFRKAYKENKPVIEIEDGAGNVTHFVGIKDKKWDVEFNKKDFGLKIDPMYSTISPNERLPKGVTLYRYRINLHFPVDARGAHGLITLIHHIRTSPEYEILNNIKDDMTLIELIDMDADDLSDSLIMKMKEYDPNFDGSDNDSDGLIIDMVDTIEAVKNELPSLKIKSERLSISDALKYIPTAFTSQDLNKALQMVEFRSKLESGFESKIMTYAIAGAIVIAVFGLVIYVLNGQGI